MPSGHVHTAINFSALCVAAAAWHAGVLLPGATPAEAGAVAAGMTIGTVLITPDLDLADGDVNAKKAWGVLGFLWTPYGKMSRHRGSSHTYVVGPVVRVVYLALIVTVIGGLAYAAGARPRLTLTEVSPLLTWLLAGYLASQWLHLLADGILPWHRGRI